MARLQWLRNVPTFCSSTPTIDRLAREGVRFESAYIGTWCMPGRIPAGRVCSAPVGGVDLVPRMFHFAGSELPWEMHGRDLSPLLSDLTSNWPHPVLLTATGRKYGSDTDVIPQGREALLGSIPWYVMLRQGRFKYVRPLITNELEELYDLREEADELRNLARSPRYRETLNQMREAATAGLPRTRAGFVDGMPPVRPGA